MPTFPADLNPGADVFSSDGHKLGELARLVLRRADLTITHVVVDIGFLRSGRGVWEGGFGLDYDRIVPVSALSSATTARVDLAMTAAEFKSAPEYTTEAYEEPQDMTPGEFDIPDAVNNLQKIAAMMNSTSGNWLVEKLNQPLEAVDIKEGLGVWREQPHDKVGEVDHGLFDPQTGKLSALVVKRGFILTHDVVLPARYIVEVIDEISVRVDISDEELSQLRRYEG
jgi:sporulation protein YlmC with PRC-barrel domain